MINTKTMHQRNIYSYLHGKSMARPSNEYVCGLARWLILIITANEWHTTVLLNFYIQEDRLAVVPKKSDGGKGCEPTHTLCCASVIIIIANEWIMAKEANQPYKLRAASHQLTTANKEI
eukprot:94885_1